MIYSGFFPISEASLTKFAKMMIEDCALVDILGSWRAEELYFQYFSINNTIACSPVAG